MVREVDMYPYVRQVLRRRFPGWDIIFRSRWSGYEPDFVVERKFGDVIERVVVEVKAVCKVGRKDVEQLNRYVRNLAGSRVKVVGKILVVPAGADTKDVPKDIVIIRLRKFKCPEKRSKAKKKTAGRKASRKKKRK